MGCAPRQTKALLLGYCAGAGAVIHSAVLGNTEGMNDVTLLHSSIGSVFPVPLSCCPDFTRVHFWTLGANAAFYVWISKKQSIIETPGMKSVLERNY